MDINMLPESCVAEILSRTSPDDALNSSHVSSAFRSVADSDFVWERFLPSGYREIVSRSSQKLKLSSKKELYQCLCQPLLIDNGKKIFKIEKSRGLKSYTLSARELSIAWGEDPMHWSWNSRSADSRFSEVAELRTSNWLEIRGKIQTRLLSPHTRYGAYLVMKMSGRAFGLDLMPWEVSVEVGSRQISENSVYLGCLDGKKQLMKRIMYGNRTERLGGGEGAARAVEREDGWMEVEIGEFNVGGGPVEEMMEGEGEMVEMSFKEVKGYQLKGGLVVEGIEIRPKQHYSS